MSHRCETVNGIRLHWAELGTGPVVVLLHGFPDFWYSWRHQIRALAGRGFQVVAPDLRGYNRSGRPEGVGRYTTEQIERDVVALLNLLDAPVAAVAGHDWGGVIAWRLAIRQPELLRQLIVLNAPHPVVYREALLRSSQLLRSWYAGFFQLPWVPEVALRAFDFAALDRALKERHRGRVVISDAELACYHRAFASPGALTAPLNYYRAAGRSAWKAAVATGRVEVPTLVVHGERDRYLAPFLLDRLPAHVPQLRIERIAEAGHFVHWHVPDQINQMFGEFLAVG